MAAFKYLQLFLVVVSMGPHVISVRDLHSHKSSPVVFPQYLVGSRRGHKIEGIQDVMRYFQRYGYLRSSNMGTNSNSYGDAFDDDLEGAVKSYQRFFKLNMSGILDAETLHQMSQPRCGVPDHILLYNDTHSGGVSRNYAFFPGKPKWPSVRFDLTYAFINDFQVYFEDPVKDAFTLWAAYSRFAFSEAPDEDSADIKISLEVGDHGDGHPFKGRTGGVLAHAFGPNDGRLHYNADEYWNVGAFPNTYDVKTVALHEIGHVLGLAHSSTQNSIMWPSIPPNFIKGLYQDDVDALSDLYGTYDD